MGDRFANLSKGIEGLELEFGKPALQSKIYETKAWGNTNQAKFLNMAVLFNCNQAPNAILEKLKNLEIKVGRKSRAHWQERELDIDIIFYENNIINTPMLIVPHALMHERNFVLRPLDEICPQFIHPVFKKNISELLEMCSDKLEVNVWKAN